MSELDNNTQVLIIRHPKHTLLMGPIFTMLPKIETLQITDGNVPSVGKHSFWGVQSLRSLGSNPLQRFFLLSFINNIYL